jgi:lipoprotein NlpD
MHFLKRSILLLLLFSCEHYASNVEIVYKNTNGSGYKSSGSILSESSNNEENELKKVKDAPKHEKLQPIGGASNQNSKPTTINPSTSTFSSQKTLTEEDTYHVVQQGETFYSIARLHNINPKDLMEWNDYSETKILKPSSIIKLTSAPISAKEIQIKEVKSNKINKENQPEVIKTATQTPLNCKSRFIMPILETKTLVNFGDVYGGGVKSDGITFKTKKEEIVRASNNGEVAYVGDGFSDYGNLVIIRHMENYFSIYGHLKNVKVKKGQLLIKGDALASTSLEEGKFYFAIRKGRNPINPKGCI